MRTTTPLQDALDAIDDVNVRDPGRDAATGEPAAQLYGRRMSARLAQFSPNADPELQIAVRGQHIERWAIPRSNYPMDRAGYFRWRNELKELHARRLTAIMERAGYDSVRIDRVQKIVRKEHFKIDPQAQTLEDVACLVFLEWYATDFAAKHDEAKVVDIVRKTWRKMSPRGQEAALRLSLPGPVAEIVAKALDEVVSRASPGD